MNYRFFSHILIFVFSGSFFAGGAFAASLTVMPVSLELSAPKQSDTVIIRNNGRVPVKMQVRIFRWDQKNGKDVYFPTADVIVSPPFVTIKGGTDGVIRVVRVTQRPLGSVETYRLFLDELPASRVRSREEVRQTGIQMLIRQILPVIFSPMRAASSELSLAFRVQSAKGGFKITAVNSGQNPLGLGSAALLAGGAKIGKVERSVGTVLPHSEYTFFVPAKKGGKPQSIQIVVKGKLVQFPIQ